MPRPRAPAGQASILVVDDRPENLTALEAVLEPVGCRIVTATSGQEALKLMLEQQFAVLLLDVHMPGMDGYEVASYVRKRHRTSTVPIIFLSAVSTSAEHVFRGYETGAVDYMVKPFDPVAIRSKVRVFIELNERGEEIRRQAELLRRRDLERAQRDAERQRHRRTALLDSLSLALEQRTDTDGRTATLVRSCVPELAELAIADIVRENQRPPATVLACSSKVEQTVLEGLLPIAGDRPPATRGADRRGRLVAELTHDEWLETVTGALGEHTWLALHPGSMIVVPLRLHRRQLGRLVLMRSRTSKPFGEDDLELAGEIAKRASLALETSRLYEVELDRSRTLQLSLLGSSQLTHPNVTSASSYVPGSAGLQVGGDWCDLIERDDGRILAVVGDVVGRGIRAATAMGKLRSAIGALALVTDDTATLLERLDRFAARIPEAELATVMCALIDPVEGTIDYSSAGHLPGLVVTPEGDSELLAGGRGFPLCVDPGAPRERGSRALPVGATLILFTDGLVEGRDSPIDAGIERLRLAACRYASDEPERLCDRLLETLVERPGDDIALVCVRLAPSPEEFVVWRFPALPNQVTAARHTLSAWLTSRGTADDLRRELEIAFTEACTNAVLHGYPGGEGTVVAQLRLDRDELTIRVSDSGGWTEPRRPRTEGGLGLGLIRALMDDVQIHGAAHGTTVVMRKQLRHASERVGDPLTQVAQ
jgi:DNA-binding response OmpR family regulator/serine phosphatase RsbU (regulator of sigma subunit)/anti-sigma regulatory factor (Ser/Thr protein kinase)